MSRAIHKSPALLSGILVFFLFGGGACARPEISLQAAGGKPTQTTTPAPQKKSPDNEKQESQQAGEKTAPSKSSTVTEPAEQAQSAPDKDKKDEKTPEFWDLVKRWVFSRWGVGGLAVLALLGLAVTVWWKWDEIKTRPGVSWILSKWTTPSLPKADPKQYSVAVALFENDPKKEHHQIVVTGLSSFPGIQVLVFARTISPRGADAKAAVAAGHQKAREFLKESGAQALIWGEVLTRGSDSVPNLYWTLAEEGAAEKAGRYAPADKELNLPEVFWSDLKDVLLLLAATQSTAFHQQTGRYIADQVRPFIEKVRSLLRGGGAHPIAGEQRATLLFLFAYALSGFGEQAGDSPALEEAITAYREALKEYTRERVPLDWAMTQNNLGNALQRLGEREAGTARLEEAVAAYREALKEYTRERVPLDWAMTQNNLGNALQRLGEREAGTAWLKEAVAAYREALKEYTRERVPLDWAMTQNNLGNALQRLGEREAGTAWLKEAVAAYREALREYTRERVPLDWAMTQNNLGNALSSLGEREAGTARLEEAVAAYREALREYTRERVPLQWATTQNNLGTVLRSLGEREAGTARLEEAVAAYREALREYTRERVPLQWATTQNNLGNALRSLGEREAGTARLEEAVDAYREALKERTQERVPLDWAMTTYNLGRALAVIALRQRNAENFCAAIVTRLEALEVFQQAEASHYVQTVGKGIENAIRQMKSTFGDAALADCRAKNAALFEILRGAGFDPDAN
jgi:tetratricopeptide (TPR) repeat protein